MGLADWIPYLVPNQFQNRFSHHNQSKNTDSVLYKHLQLNLALWNYILCPSF
jgi:hypothetical protein